MNFALIGSGHVVRTKHIEAYEGLKGRIVPYALVDPDENVRRETGNLFAIPEQRRFSSLDGLASIRKEINAVVVATPQVFHCEPVVFAARHGWHVLCEKPLAMNMEEMDRMLAAADESSVRFGVVHNFYYMNVAGDAHTVIKQGTIGQVRLVRGESYSAPYHAGQWRADKSISGHGHFLHCFYHEVYLTRSVINSPIRKLFAQQAHLTTDQSMVEDTMMCQIEFENGALAIFQDCNAFPNGGGGAVIFETHGTEGSVLRNIPLTTPCGVVYADGKQTSIEKNPKMTKHGMLGVFDAFVTSIETGNELPYEIAAKGDGRDNLETIDWIYESARSGQVVVVN